MSSPVHESSEEVFLDKVLEWFIESQRSRGYFAIQVSGIFSDSWGLLWVSGQFALHPRIYYQLGFFWYHPSSYFIPVTCREGLNFQFDTMRESDAMFKTCLHQSFAKLMQDLSPDHSGLLVMDDQCPFCPCVVLSSIIGIEYVDSQGTKNSMGGNDLHRVWPLVGFFGMPN